MLLFLLPKKTCTGYHTTENVSSQLLLRHVSWNAIKVLHRLTFSHAGHTNLHLCTSIPLFQCVHSLQFLFTTSVKMKEKAFRENTGEPLKTDKSSEENLNRPVRARDRSSSRIPPQQPTERGTHTPGCSAKAEEPRAAPHPTRSPKDASAQGKPRSGSDAVSAPLPPRGCRARHLRDGTGRVRSVPPCAAGTLPVRAATGSRRRHLSEGRGERRGRRGSAPPPPAPARPGQTHRHFEPLPARPAPAPLGPRCGAGGVFPPCRNRRPALAFRPRASCTGTSEGILFGLLKDRDLPSRWWRSEMAF